MRARLSRVLGKYESSGVTEKQVRAMIFHSWAQEFIADDGSTVITQIREEPNGTVMTIWLAEGQMDGCLACLDEIEKRAKSIGAYAIRITGRAGWVRQLHGRGYSEIARVLERRL